MKRIGENVAETLDYVPDVFPVARHIRGKWACAKWDAITQGRQRLATQTQTDRNKGLRVRCASADERNFSVWMSRSKSRPCIRVERQASIMTGGPHR